MGGNYHYRSAPRRALMVVSLLNVLLGAAICAYGSYMAYMADVHVAAGALATLGGLVVVFSVIGFLGGRDEKNWMLLGVSTAAELETDSSR